MTPGPVVYLNGRYLPYSEASLPLHDAGFAYGATVTDRLRTFRQEPFRLDDHLRRFRQSCDLGRIPQPQADDALRSIVHEVIDRNRRNLPPGQELSVVFFATPGPLGSFSGRADDGPPTLGVYGLPFSCARYRPLFEGGAWLAGSRRSLPADAIDPRIKHRSRLPWWIAERDLDGTGAAPLFVDGAGHVLETPAANFLTIRDGAVISPPRNTALNGVALQVTEELCGALEIPFVERELLLSDLVKARGECLLTNSSFCVAGVSRLEGAHLSWPGPVWQRLLEAWSDLVRVDIRSQILTNP